MTPKPVSLTAYFYRHTPTALLFAGLTLTGCALFTDKPQTPAVTQAKIVQTGIIRCFKQPPLPEQPTTCELSAAAREGNTIVFANDKPIPKLSPVFALPFDGQHLADSAQPDYYQGKPFVDTQKYESMTKTPDGQWMLASAAFDRHAEDKAEYDAYNRVLAWPASHREKVAVLAATTRAGITSSSSLRGALAQALNPTGKPVEYFKIEGLAAIPGNKLLFGVREIGKSYKDFRYTVTILETSYTEQDGKLGLDGNFKIAYVFPEQALRQIPENVGLSSIEYDAAHHRLLILTSFELGDAPKDRGAYLWALPMQDFRAGGNPPGLVMAGNQPLKFTHKAEGLAILDAQRVLVIHDDDRVKPLVDLGQGNQARPRELDESVFQILEIE